MKNYFNLIGIIFLLSSCINAVPETDSSINPLDIKRTYTKDLGGYSQKEKDAAKKILHETLYPERNRFRETIKLLQAKRGEATTAAISELNTINEHLKDLNKQIENQEIIAGERSSTLVKTMKYVGVAAIVTAGLVMADQYWNEGVITDNLAEKLFGHDVILHGGVLPYLRNTIFGEPYKIKQPSELQVWDNSIKEWKSVIGNEELAKHAPLKTSKMWNWKYSDLWDIIIPVRAAYCFWDEKNGVYREATHAEMEGDLYDELFIWPKYGVPQSKKQK